MGSPPQPQSSRLLKDDGALNVVRVGAPRYVLRDLYLRLLSASWPRLMLLFAGSYVLGNFVFAELYLINGPNIENARDGSFVDAFFFSVQTMATIGYGKMVPSTFWGNVLVTVESFMGLLGLAVATGLIFAKFSRPSARVEFSRQAIIGRRDGVPSLMFRVANQRGNQIVEAQLHVVLARTETTIEGESLRRLYDLPLLRGTNALFALSWTAVHPIVPGSPLFGLTRQAMVDSDSEIVISLTGLDETFSQTIHARYSYSAAEFVWNARFADILSQREDGRRQIDFRLFHEIHPENHFASGEKR